MIDNSKKILKQFKEEIRSGKLVYKDLSFDIKHKMDSFKECGFMIDHLKKTYKFLESPQEKELMYISNSTKRLTEEYDEFKEIVDYTIKKVENLEPKVGTYRSLPPNKYY